MDIQTLLQKQQSFYKQQETKKLSFRLQALDTLKHIIIKNETAINQALKEDLNKSPFETYMTEIGMVLSELSYIQKYLPKWYKPHKVKTPLTQFHAKSYTLSEPYGVCLIMSPWNYPFQLTMEPLIGSIAGGNCSIIKPSAYATHTSQLVENLIKQAFPEDYISVIQGGRQENTALLEQSFDFIFFTGGVTVGKLVMEKAAQHLTPVCLELGGKSPCIVDHTADIPLSAKRIAFGKFLNAGQTCVAPDYLLAHESIKEQLISEIKKNIHLFFGDNPLDNQNLPKIINEKHFKRLMNLIQSEDIYCGGNTDKQIKISPTIVDNVSPESSLMQEEIFGPILPVLTYQKIEDIIEFITNRPKPLALYLFSSSKETQNKILQEVSFGGGCINDTIIHLATSNMGFGGVGSSGMGNYHGKKSFETFTHEKSIVNKSTWLDLSMRYHPYTEKNYKMLKRFLK